MSHASNNLPIDKTTSDQTQTQWRPNAELATLKARAQLLSDIRHFFAERSVLEVETPLLCATAATDPYIQAIEAKLFLSLDNHEAPKFFLQTSPEFAMKRLLAEGVGPMYQICKAFRNGELGQNHNPEFTILEWYRPGFDHHQLMDEVDELLQHTLKANTSDRISYQNLFLRELQIDPLTTEVEALRDSLLKFGIHMDAIVLKTLTAGDCLQILMSHCIEPKLGFERPMMVYDFPVSQAALSKIRSDSPPVAERFEVYMNGLEIANGYHELTDSEQQRKRFEKDCDRRRELDLSEMPIDYRLIEALKFGLPDCAGIAFGIDRLLMIKMQCKVIREVLSFDIENA